MVMTIKDGNGKIDSFEISTLEQIIFNVHVKNIGFMPHVSLGPPCIEAR